MVNDQNLNFLRPVTTSGKEETKRYARKIQQRKKELDRRIFFFQSVTQAYSEIA